MVTTLSQAPHFVNPPHPRALPTLFGDKPNKIKQSSLQSNRPLSFFFTHYKVSTINLSPLQSLPPPPNPTTKAMIPFGRGMGSGERFKNFKKKKHQFICFLSSNFLWQLPLPSINSYMQIDSQMSGKVFKNPSIVAPLVVVLVVCVCVCVTLI